MLSHRILPINSGIQPDFRLGTGVTGIANLPRAMTINGVTRNPDIFLAGNNASASGWTADFGHDFAITGTGASPDLTETTPYLDQCVKCTAKSYVATDTSDGNIGTKDLVIEWVYRTPSAQPSASQYFWLKRGDAPLTEIQIFQYSGGQFYCDIFYENSLVAEFGTTAPLSVNAWHHIMLVLDRSAYGCFIVDGALASSASNISSSSSSAIDSSGILEIIGYGPYPSTPTNIPQGYLASFGVWSGATWLDSYNQSAIAMQRLAIINGCYPIASGARTPVTMSRSTNAYLDRYVSSSQRKLFNVGPNWIRTVERKDSVGNSLSGLLIEPQAENLLTYSQAMDGWTKVNITADSITNAGAPDGTATLNAIIADATAGNHGYTQEHTAAGTTIHNLSVYAKKGANNWLYMSDTGPAAATAYFDLNTGVLGTVGADCRAYIDDFGGGLYRCEIAFTAVAEAKNCVIYSAEADGDITFSGDAASKYTYIWGAQLEDGVERASSYVYTAAAAATRVKDQLQYASAGSVTAGTGTITAKVLYTEDTGLGGTICAISNAGDADYKFQLDIDTSEHAHCTSVVSATVQASIVGTTSMVNGLIHRVHTQWAANDIRLYVDSISQGTRDTSCSVGVSMTVIDVGQDTEAANQIGAVINELRIYRKPLKG